MIALECFIAVHELMWKSVPPVRPYVRPLQSVLVSDGDRYILHILVLPLLVLLELVGEPLGLRSE